MNRRREPAALLIDFDGVLRHHDGGVTAAIEARAGLRPGEILAAAFARQRLVPAILGQVDRAGWLSSIAAELADRAGGQDAVARMLAEWDAYRGEIVPEVRAFVAEMRTAGVPVALTTNATTDLRDDLRRFGLTEAFDAVLSSSEIGVAKPAGAFFEAACSAIDTKPEQCLLLDDTPRNIAGARAAGLLAYRYTGTADLGYLRRAFAR